jgi:hypothetical protein
MREIGTKKLGYHIMSLHIKPKDDYELEGKILYCTYSKLQMKIPHLTRSACNPISLMLIMYWPGDGSDREH